MRSFTCGLSLAVLSFCLLVQTGCSEDNESAFKEQASKTGSSKGDSAKLPPAAKSQAEYGQQQEASKTSSKAAGYPGAKR